MDSAGLAASSDLHAADSVVHMANPGVDLVVLRVADLVVPRVAEVVVRLVADLVVLAPSSDLPAVDSAVRMVDPGVDLVVRLAGDLVVRLVEDLVARLAVDSAVLAGEKSAVERSVARKKQRKRNQPSQRNLVNQLKRKAESRRSAVRSLGRNAAEVRMVLLLLAEALDMAIHFVVDMDSAGRAVGRSAARKRQRKGKVSRVKNQLSQGRVRSRRSGGRGRVDVHLDGDLLQGSGHGVVLVPGNSKPVHW
jgi:hypothetical protein